MAGYIEDNYKRHGDHITKGIENFLWEMGKKG